MISSIRVTRDYPVSIADDDEWALGACRGDADNANWDMLLSQVSRDCLVVDVGAHLGTFAVRAAALGAFVIAIEAGSSNVEHLRRTARLNPDLRIEVVHGAAWSKPGRVRFREDRAYGMICAEGGAEIDAVTVDDIVDLYPRSMRNPDVFVKIDVEGSEPQVLRGMQHLLAFDPVVFYESNSHTLALQGSDILEPRRILAESGYVSFLIHEGVLYRLGPEDSQPLVYADVIALRRESDMGDIAGMPLALFQSAMLAGPARLPLPDEGKAHVRRELLRRPDLASSELLHLIGE